MKFVSSGRVLGLAFCLFLASCTKADEAPEIMNADGFKVTLEEALELTPDEPSNFTLKLENTFDSDISEIKAAAVSDTETKAEALKFTIAISGCDSLAVGAVCNLQVAVTPSSLKEGPFSQRIRFEFMRNGVREVFFFIATGTFKAPDAEVTKLDVTYPNATSIKLRWNAPVEKDVNKYYVAIRTGKLAPLRCVADTATATTVQQVVFAALPGSDGFASFATLYVNPNSDYRARLCVERRRGVITGTQTTEVITVSSGRVIVLKSIEANPLEVNPSFSNVMVGSATLNFPKVSSSGFNVSKYLVQVSDTNIPAYCPNPTYEVAGTVASHSKKFDRAGNTFLYVRVCVVNSNNPANVSPGVERSQFINSPPPPRPINVTASNVGYGSAYLRWSMPASSDLYTYNVQPGGAACDPASPERLPSLERAVELFVGGIVEVRVCAYNNDLISPASSSTILTLNVPAADPYPAHMIMSCNRLEVIGNPKYGVISVSFRAPGGSMVETGIRRASEDGEPACPHVYNNQQTLTGQPTALVYGGAGFTAELATAYQVYSCVKAKNGTQYVRGPSVVVNTPMSNGQGANCQVNALTWPDFYVNFDDKMTITRSNQAALKIQGSCSEKGGVVDLYGSISARANCDMNNRFEATVDVSHTSGTSVLVSAKHATSYGTAYRTTYIARDVRPAPTLKFVLPAADAQINNANPSPTVNLACSENTRNVVLKINGQNAGNAYCSSGSASIGVAWSQYLTGRSGEVVLTAEHSNSLQETVVATRTIPYIKTAPAPAITAPLTDIYFDGASLFVKATCTPKSWVTISHPNDSRGVNCSSAGDISFNMGSLPSTSFNLEVNEATSFDETARVSVRVVRGDAKPKQVKFNADTVAPTAGAQLSWQRTDVSLALLKQRVELFSDEYCKVPKSQVLVHKKDDSYLVEGLPAGTSVSARVVSLMNNGSEYASQECAVVDVFPKWRRTLTGPSEIQILGIFNVDVSTALAVGTTGFGLRILQIDAETGATLGVADVAGSEVFFPKTLTKMADGSFLVAGPHIDENSFVVAKVSQGTQQHSLGQVVWLKSILVPGIRMGVPIVAVERPDGRIAVASYLIWGDFTYRTFLLAADGTLLRYSDYAGTQGNMWSRGALASNGMLGFLNTVSSRGALTSLYWANVPPPAAEGDLLQWQKPNVSTVPLDTIRQDEVLVGQDLLARPSGGFFVVGSAPKATLYRMDEGGATGAKALLGLTPFNSVRGNSARLIHHQTGMLAFVPAESGSCGILKVDSNGVTLAESWVRGCNSVDAVDVGYGRAILGGRGQIFRREIE